MTTWEKAAGFLGNTVILFTFLRVFIGITVVAQNILGGMLAVAIIIGLVVYWEREVPTKGIARLKRGSVVFLATVLIDAIFYLLFA